MLNRLCQLIILITICHCHRITDSLILPTGKGIYWGKDCPGNDLYHFESAPLSCLYNCQRTKDCTHIVWNTVNNGTCWLKNGKFSFKNLLKSIDGETVCAKITFKVNDNSFITQFNGNTTYQWTCRLPQCSRKANILRSNKRVKVCLNDGYNISEVIETISIGSFKIPTYNPSYMCNDQQPWIINDQLAYGYAFISGDRIESIDYCCTCYQLNFTNDLIKNKTMIVQIIDYQREFSDSKEMILYIPGYGSDNYQCIKQWEYPYGNIQYKYPLFISSREKCFNLPKSIQNGCLFRFDWLKNSSNPPTIYTKVNCPQELIQRSGCYQGIIN